MPGKRPAISELGFHHGARQARGLVMKQLVKSFNFFPPGQQEQEKGRRALAHGERIVAELGPSFLACASNGKLVHCFVQEPKFELTTNSLGANEQKALFVSKHSSALCLGIAMGSAQRGATAWQGRLDRADQQG